MKADGEGPDGVPARVTGLSSRPGRLVVALYPGVERSGGSDDVRADVAVDLVPGDCRAEGSYLLLIPETGDRERRRFVSAIPLPRVELWLRVPGPFREVHGRAFVERVVGPLEQALLRGGLSDYVHPWTFPEPGHDDWECCFAVNNIRGAVTAARAALSGLGLHPGSVIEVRDNRDEPCRAYPLTDGGEAGDWADLADVERSALLSPEMAVRWFFAGS